MKNLFNKLLVRRTKHFVENPEWMVAKFVVRYFPKFATDRQYIIVKWANDVDYPLDLNNPHTYCEKLQWLKLYDRNPLYHKLVDKAEVKEYVAKLIGDKYVVKTLGVWDMFDDIDFELLPNKFVLKCTHNSSFPVICRNKQLLDIDDARNRIERDLAVKDYYECCREWAYKGVKPRIIAEELLEDDTFEDLVNYKFLCFHGEPRLMYITTKTDHIWENFYDMDFNPIDICHYYKDMPNVFDRYTNEIKKPECFEEMKEIARTLSANIPHVRIDLYQIQGKVKFSEYTFYNWSGFVQIRPYEWNLKIGEWLTLDK